MKLLKTTLCSIAIISSSTAFAEQCPDYLPTQLMTDCIVETGAGSSYDAEKHYKAWRQAQAERLEALDAKSDKPSVPVAQN